MINFSSNRTLEGEPFDQTVRLSSSAENADVLADIYNQNINIAIWRRTLTRDLKSATERLLESEHVFRISTSLTPDETVGGLFKTLGMTKEAKLISDDVGEIVTMFCYLFDLSRVGLRLTTLERAMCPKFHVDRVPCRLVMTYGGTATEWLPHETVDRMKLGTGSNGKTDEESGLYRAARMFNNLTLAILRF